MGTCWNTEEPAEVGHAAAATPPATSATPATCSQSSPFFSSSHDSARLKNSTDCCSSGSVTPVHTRALYM